MSRAPVSRDYPCHLSLDSRWSLSGSWASRHRRLQERSPRSRGLQMRSSGVPRDESSLATVQRGLTPRCLSLFYLSQYLFCQVVKYILSPQEILSLYCSPSKQICIYNRFFFKTCIMQLIDWNDSLGEVPHSLGCFFVVCNIHLFYMAIYFPLLWMVGRAMRRRNHPPKYELHI